MNGNGDLHELEVGPEEVAYEAKEVQLLLGKAAVQAAFVATKARFVGEWERAANTAEREFCWAKVKALEAFQSTLRGWADRVSRVGS